MSIEDGGLDDAIIESAEDETDWEECPVCEEANWLRAVAAYPNGACGVIYCGGCGKTIQKRWNISP